MIVIHLRIAYILFGSVILLLHYGCSSTQPAPEEVVNPSPAPVVSFGETDLRWLVLLPEHHPSSQAFSPIVPKPKPFLHVVTTPGETLIAIARWYTGDPQNWHHLVQVNNDLDPQRMEIGATIMIPEHLLITRQLMPKRRNPTQHPHNPPPVNVQSSDRAATPQLFGPIEIPRSPGMEKTTALPRPLQRLDESE